LKIFYENRRPDESFGKQAIMNLPSFHAFEGHGE